MRFKITDIDNERYYQMPKSLFSYQAYIDLSLQAKVIYCILKDRMSLSRRNHWIDANDDIYLMFQQQEIADILHINKSTVCREMKNLVAYGLIEISDQGRGRCHRIYINKIRVPESAEEILDIESQLGEAAKQAEEEEARYQAMLHPEQAEAAICNSRVAYRQPPVADSQTRVASEQLRVAPGQPQVAHRQPQVAAGQPKVAPVQPNDTNLENLTSKTECSEPERKKNEEDEEDTRASAQPAPAPSSDDPDGIQEVCDFCAANLHPQTPLVPIEREMLRAWCQTYTPEWVRAAVHDAVLYGHPTLQYMSKILESWKQYGFRVRPEKKSYPQQPAAGGAAARHSRKNPSAQQMVDNVKAMWEDMGVEL